ncbi:uncharacterized protein LOC126688539 [Quercus robur]|uniref:uncharacterized protein LOC126688539 n=1 Tax=Quercus robur TaxID=38942 RepID=UPI0021639753|nr:uncharacterized protein LOC126688539 [Quercus robur]XP_050239218.1 uncharacterized protein LOC126688539 [Quercus robur]XP_050239219.1 uncharacterized protein LOC126688539 [Quercus robur]XP_050239220.1 uncharacterized protein LOC126688539 [Quercus robur]XP_050239221.1 uncharacterized protein LOC126688539 [Quercus robur]XP_050239222.1 uncharacterized protein LOC126688539 [Quercus robur]XP_050239224.1 uncharacterized protein LOC126688539 [Quercus robur]
MAMEELHMAALAYYNNSNRDLQNKAWDFFNSMDSNGNGRVSYEEFIHFFGQYGYNWEDRNFYHSLDRDHDGLLDFWEVLTLYYILKTRSVRCQCCSACQIGLYFTCVTCFHSARHTFDICIGCYSTQTYKRQHDHDVFLDSYVLLRSKKGPPPGLPDLNQALIPVQPNVVINAPERSRWWTALAALKSAIAVLSIGSSISSLLSCSIM